LLGQGCPKQAFAKIATPRYEKIYLNDFNTVNEAYLGLKEYFEFYNNKRFHQSLDNQTPADVHLAGN
jgi:putative transposase